MDTNEPQETAIMKSDNPHELISKLSKARLVSLIESVGAAAYEDEDIRDLRECVFESVEAGDIDETELYETEDN